MFYVIYVIKAGANWLCWKRWKPHRLRRIPCSSGPHIWPPEPPRADCSAKPTLFQKACNYHYCHRMSNSDCNEHIYIYNCIFDFYYPCSYWSILQVLVFVMFYVWFTAQYFFPWPSLSFSLSTSVVIWLFCCYHSLRVDMHKHISTYMYSDGLIITPA